MIKRNLITNFGAKFWSVFSSIIFLPYYIRFLGIEAYGLIGVFGTFSAILSLLDLGLSTTANRETARMVASNKTASEIGNFTRTIEIVYWATAITLALIFISSSSLIAHHWFHSSQLDPSTIQNAIICIGLTIAFTWPFAFYSGALMGLEKQVALNIITTVFSTLRSLGCILVLAFISPTIEAFFIWQAGVNLAQTLIAALVLWRSLPSRTALPKFEFAILKNIWRFAAGMSGISVTILVLTNLDKIFLSRLLSLENFGYYTIAMTIASGLNHFTGPVFNAFFPRFSQQVAVGNEGEVKRLYHLSSQLVSCLILPTAALLLFFPAEVMGVWGINPKTIEAIHLLLPLLVIGTTLNSFLSMSYALQLSYGWTRLPLIQNIIAICLLVPPMFWATQKFGALGAAGIWILLNLGYFLITIPVMHTRLLKSEMRSWYLYDIFVPFLSVFSVIYMSRLAFPVELNRITTFCWLGTSFLGGVITALLSSGLLRQHLFKYFELKREANK